MEIASFSFFRAYRRVHALYRSAFPPAERVGWYAMVCMALFPGFHFRALTADGRFCGFCYYVTDKDLLCLYYLAIDPAFRGKGVGSEVLRRLKEQGKPVALLTEAADVPSDNARQRTRRIAFYRRAGFHDLGVHLVDASGTYALMSERRDTDPLAVKRVIDRFTFWVPSVVRRVSAPSPSSDR